MYFGAISCSKYDLLWYNMLGGRKTRRNLLWEDDCFLLIVKLRNPSWVICAPLTINELTIFKHHWIGLDGISIG